MPARPAPPLPTRPRAAVFDALPRLDRQRPKGSVRRSRAGRWRLAALLLVHLLIGLHVWHWLAAGRTLSPLEPSESMQTLERGLVNAGFLLFLLAIGSTLLFGRWFCGWACHVVALQDASAWLLGRFGLRPRPLRSRLLVLVPWLEAGYMFVWPQLERLWRGRPLPALQFELTTDAFWQTFPSLLMAIATFVVVGFVVVWWLGAKGFCTHGCPYGAVFALADRLAPMRIRVDRDACEHCGHCTSVCSSNVRVHEEVARHGMVVDPGCMKCMDCVSVCPNDALRVGFGRIAPLQTSQQRLQARADCSWGEELLLLATGAGAFAAFHGAWFGEDVPLLLAVALAAITAVLALLGWRLWRQRQLTFQHAELKRDGRLLPRGRLAALLVAGWLGFTLHTGIVHAAGRAAVGDAVALLQRFRDDPRSVRGSEAAAVTAALAAVDRWSCCTSPRVLGMLGLLLRLQAQNEAAIAALERMHGRYAFGRVRVPEAELALAAYYAGSGRADAAAAICEDLLARHPHDASARDLLRRLGREPAPAGSVPTGNR